MAWTTPKTDWTTGDLVAASDLNAIGENFNTIQNPPTAVYITTATININGSTFVDVDTTNLNLTIDTNGGDIMVHFDGTIHRGNSTSGETYFDVEMDGTRLGGTNGIASGYANSNESNVSFTRIIQNVTAGTHTFKLQARETIGNDHTADLYAEANFWVREI